MHGIDSTSLAVLSERVIELQASAVGTVAVTAFFFWLTVRRLQRLDVA